MISEDKIVELIKKADIQLETELDPKLSLSEQGIDSLDMATLYLSIEEELGVSIPEDQEEKLTSIQEIVKYVNAQ